MDYTSSNTNYTLGTNYFSLTGSGTCYTATDTASTTFTIILETDWMPYDYFEYDPLWHKKYAAIKLQMETMWD